MSYLITYGNTDAYTTNYSNSLSSLYSTTNIIDNTFTLNGSCIVDTSFNLQLNYSAIPSTYVIYTITAIRIE